MLFRSNDTATTEIYTEENTLSLHDALPISGPSVGCWVGDVEEEVGRRGRMGRLGLARDWAAGKRNGGEGLGRFGFWWADWVGFGFWVFSFSFSFLFQHTQTNLDSNLNLNPTLTFKQIK